MHSVHRGTFSCMSSVQQGLLERMCEKQQRVKSNAFLENKYGLCDGMGRSYSKKTRDVPTQKFYVPCGHTLGHFMCLFDNPCAQSLPCLNLSMNMDNSPFTNKDRNFLSNLIYWSVVRSSTGLLM